MCVCVCRLKPLYTRIITSVVEQVSPGYLRARVYDVYNNNIIIHQFHMWPMRQPRSCVIISLPTRLTRVHVAATGRDVQSIRRRFAYTNVCKGKMLGFSIILPQRKKNVWTNKNKTTRNAKNKIKKINNPRTTDRERWERERENRTKVDYYRDLVICPDHYRAGISSTFLLFDRRVIYAGGRRRRKKHIIIIIRITHALRV